MPSMRTGSTGVALEINCRVIILEEHSIRLPDSYLKVYHLRRRRESYIDFESFMVKGS